MYQQLQNLIKNQNNPQQFLNQITSSYTPDQMQSFVKFANGYGISNEQLQQYGIKTK